jgi:hypothetical protein
LQNSWTGTAKSAVFEIGCDRIFEDRLPAFPRAAERIRDGFDEANDARRGYTTDTRRRVFSRSTEAHAA